MDPPLLKALGLLPPPGIWRKMTPGCTTPAPHLCSSKPKAPLIHTPMVQLSAPPRVSGQDRGSSFLQGWAGMGKGGPPNLPRQQSAFFSPVIVGEGLAAACCSSSSPSLSSPPSPPSPLSTGLAPLPCQLKVPPSQLSLLVPSSAPASRAAGKGGRGGQ